MLIIPAIDIQNGKCVRLFKGNFKKTKIYSDNHISVAKFWENNGAKLLHVIDLNGAERGEMRNKEIIESIAKSITIPIQVGGGIRNYDEAKELLSNNIERIIIGTAFFDNPILVKKLMDDFGQEKIVVAIDVKDGKVVLKGWSKKTQATLYEIAEQIKNLGVNRILVTSVERDGTLIGPDIPLLRRIKKLFKIPVIASGGIGSLADIKKLSKIDLEGIIIGKAFYEGCFTFKEAVESAKGA